MAFDQEQERQTRARIDELGILRHAQHLKAIAGQDRAIHALQAAIGEISSTDIFKLFAQLRSRASE